MLLIITLAYYLQCSLHYYILKTENNISNKQNAKLLPYDLIMPHLNVKLLIWK